jgi:hypothetical protein
MDLNRNVSLQGRLALLFGVCLTVAVCVICLVPAAEAYDCAPCELDNDRCRSCIMGSFGDLRNADIRVVAKTSKSDCNEGRSRRVERNAIWVDKGCRARFEINYEGCRPNQSWNRGHNWDPHGRYHGHESYNRYDRNSLFLRSDYHPNG